MQVRIGLQKPLSDAEENKGLKFWISGNCDTEHFSEGFKTQQKDHDCEHTNSSKRFKMQRKYNFCKLATSNFANKNA
jgi:hypothetical protein